MVSEILSIQNVSSGYDPELPVIKGVNVSVMEGGFVSIVGANGAGKSTLLKTIYGFLKPISGKIFYKKLDITGIEPHEAKRRGMAYIPQDLCPFPNMSVEENLRMGMWSAKNNKKLEERIETVYELFPNLSRKRKQKASNLSGGETKMLDIARALVIKPDILLVDEPSVGLSPLMAEQIYKTIKRINEDERIAVLLVDQNIKRAIEVSDYTYYMENGEVAYHGASKEVVSVVDKIIEATLMGDLLKL